MTIYMHQCLVMRIQDQPIRRIRLIRRRPFYPRRDHGTQPQALATPIA